jgi:hypothetical protein
MIFCARATRGLRMTRGSRQTVLLARRTRTIRMCSSDARSEEQSAYSLWGSWGIRRPSLGLVVRLGQSIAKQSEGQAGEKYLAVGGRVRKLSAVMGGRHRAGATWLPSCKVFSACCGGEEEKRKGLESSLHPWRHAMTGTHGIFTSCATKPLVLRNCPPEFLGTRSLSNIDRSTAANDPRPSTSFSARKNPQRISANTLPVFPGLWPRLIRLVTKAMSDRLPVDYLSRTRKFPSRLLTKSASGVLTSLRGSTYGTVYTIRFFARCGLAGRPF